MPTPTELEYMKNKTYRDRKKRRRQPMDNTTVDEAAHPRHKPYERERAQDWLRSVDPDMDGEYELPDSR